MKIFNYKILLFFLLMICSGCSAVADSRGASIVISHTKDIKIDKSLSNQFGNYHALLIYVDDYTYLDKLVTPKNDVEKMAQILKNRYGFIETKIIKNPKNSDELVAILDNLSQKMGENDNLLIYYAGHGTYFKQGDTGYWLLKDAHKKNRVGWISLNEAINFTLNNMSAKHILVISDSCYSGAIVRDAKVSLSQKSDITYQNLNRLKSRTALTSGGLEPVLDGDYGNSKNSVFANGVLSVLKNNTKPRFILEEKFPSIKHYVKLKSSQTPLYSDIKNTGHTIGGDFIFIDRTIKQPKEPIYTKTTSYSNNKRGKSQYRLPYIQECNSGDGKACYNTAIMYKRGDNGVMQSDTVALGFFDKSCKLNYAKGCLGVGFAYAKGNGISQNSSKAQEFFQKSCSLGLKKACIK